MTLEQRRCEMIRKGWLRDEVALSPMSSAGAAVQVLKGILLRRATSEHHMSRQDVYLSPDIVRS